MAKDEIIKQGIRNKIAKVIKEFYYIPNPVRLNYKDLFIHSDLDLLGGFKVPKFNTFSGSSNTLVHLRSYCDQFIGIEENVALLMRLFNQSLSGEALNLFTSQEMKQW